MKEYNHERPKQEIYFNHELDRLDEFKAQKNLWKSV